MHAQKIMQVGLRATDPEGGVRLLLERNRAPGILYYQVPAIDAAVAKLYAKGVAIDSPAARR